MPKELRLSPTSYAVLGLLDVWGPCTPYDLKQAIETTVQHFWPVPHTTFYAEPARLEEAGLLAVKQEAHGRRKKLYSVTAEGKAALAAWLAEPSAAPPQLRDELVLKTFLGADTRPLLEQRIAWHREQLAELEGYLELVRAGEGTPGIEASLVAGTSYHRALIEMNEQLRSA